MARTIPVSVLAAMAALLPAAPATGESEPADGPIVGGEATDGDPAVVALIDPLGLRCTGTLIGPHLVLTAAHCFSGSTWTVAFGPIPATPEAQRGVARWIVHPGWDPATLAYDVALIVLDEAAPATIAPAVIARVPPPGWQDGAPLRIVGFGKRSEHDVDPPRKRTGRTTVDVLARFTFSLAANEARTCHGDSGGPAFTDDGAGGEQLVGVTSYGDKACQFLSVDQRVDTAAADFIGPYLALDVAGALVAGAPCLTDAGCGAGLRCVSDEAERLFGCGGACETGADCPARMASCTPDLMGLTCRPGGGALGDACASTPECRDGLCLVQDGEHRCAMPCAPADCPPLDGGEGGGSGGCAADGGGGLGAAVLALIALALAMQSRSPCADRSWSSCSS